jgi:hypothetical protein
MTISNYPAQRQPNQEITRGAFSLNRVGGAISVQTGSFNISLTETTAKSSLEEQVQLHEAKNRYHNTVITKTCGCCLREVAINKNTGKMHAHIDPRTGAQCFASGSEPLEISDDSIVAAVKTWHDMKRSYTTRAKMFSPASKAYKQLMEKAAQVEDEIISFHLDMLISYRNLKAKAAKEAEAEKKLLSAACPCCGLEAHGEEEVEDLFGYRTSKKSERTLVQSYCRGCRKAKAVEYRAKNRAKKAAKKILDIVDSMIKDDNFQIDYVVVLPIAA